MDARGPPVEDAVPDESQAPRGVAECVAVFAVFRKFCQGRTVGLLADFPWWWEEFRKSLGAIGDRKVHDAIVALKGNPARQEEFFVSLGSWKEFRDPTLLGLLKLALANSCYWASWETLQASRKLPDGCHRATLEEEHGGERVGVVRKVSAWLVPAESEVGGRASLRVYALNFGVDDNAAAALRAAGKAILGLVRRRGQLRGTVFAAGTAPPLAALRIGFDLAASAQALRAQLRHSCIVIALESGPYTEVKGASIGLSAFLAIFDVIFLSGARNRFLLRWRRRLARCASSGELDGLKVLKVAGIKNKSDAARKDKKVGLFPKEGCPAERAFGFTTLGQVLRLISGWHPMRAVSNLGLAACTPAIALMPLGASGFLQPAPPFLSLATHCETVKTPLVRAIQVPAGQSRIEVQVAGVSGETEVQLSDSATGSEQGRFMAEQHPGTWSSRILEPVRNGRASFRYNADLPGAGSLEVRIIDKGRLVLATGFTLEVRP